MTSTFENFKLEVQSKEQEASAAIRQAKMTYDTKAEEIRTNTHLTSEGRSAQYQALRTELQAELSNKLAKISDEHSRASQAANALARKVITQSKHKEPAADEVALFEKELTDLKTSLMLESRYNSALQKINEFEAKYTDGFFSEKLLAELPGFISTVLPLAQNKDEARAVLKRLHTTLNDRAKTDEQKQAEHYLQYYSEPQLMSRESIDYRVLIDLFGAHAASKLIK